MVRSTHRAICATEGDSVQKHSENRLDVLDCSCDRAKLMCIYYTKLCLLERFGFCTENS